VHLHFDLVVLLQGARMADASFFEMAKDQSQVKAAIVAKYFYVWANVVLPTAMKQNCKIAYIDLFAGPGRYKDGTNSTPLKVLETAIASEKLRRCLVTLFNDRDPESVSSLKAAIKELPNIETLKHKPQVINEEVGSEIVKTFESMRLVPTLFFVDPWGYKGLSLGLINSVLHNWGCDCLFFFNYNRINMALTNDAVREHMEVLFGEERARAIRQELEGLDPAEREILILERLSDALKDMGANFVLPFTFKNERGTRTSHHLIFASKHFKGYEIMKGIMAHESSEQDQGVPSFEYSPATERFPTLFELTRPLDDLENMLLIEYAGKSLTMREIYEKHNIGRRFIESNYKKVLAKMEANGEIEANPPMNERPKRKGEATFGNGVMVKFSGIARSIYN
jgi:three-Cys-motif partner protein